MRFLRGHVQLALAYPINLTPIKYAQSSCAGSNAVGEFMRAVFTMPAADTVLPHLAFHSPKRDTPDSSRKAALIRELRASGFYLGWKKQALIA